MVEAARTAVGTVYSTAAIARGYAHLAHADRVQRTPPDEPIAPDDRDATW